MLNPPPTKVNKSSPCTVVLVVLTMNIINDDVRLNVWVFDNPKASSSVSNDLSIEHWTMKIAMS